MLFEHVVFRKVRGRLIITLQRASARYQLNAPQTKRNERMGNMPYTIPRGMDPDGNLSRLGNEWRLRDRPALYRQDADNVITPTTAVSFEPGDFVEVIAHLDLVTFQDEDVEGDVIEMCLAMERVTRLYSAAQLKVSALQSMPCAPEHLRCCQDMQYDVTSRQHADHTVDQGAPAAGPSGSSQGQVMDLERD